MKKQIFDFIKMKTPELKEVLSFKAKDIYDEDGFIGEHYVVKCLLGVPLSVPYTNIPINNMLGEQEKTCLVNISEFTRWVKSEESVKWI